MRQLARFVLVIGVGGCATAPNLGPAPEPKRSGALAAERSLAGTPQEWPQDEWWRAFGDPQLDALVAEALQCSPTIAQTVARIRVAMAQADLARAARLPHASVTATARESRITQNVGLPTDGEWHLLLAGLANVSYDLDLWGRNRLALRAAVSAAQASEADPIFDGGARSANYTRARGEYDGAVAGYDATLLDALRQVADAATSLRALGPRSRRIEAALARNEAAYRLSRIRYEGGLSDHQAVLISENALLATREQAASIRLRGFMLDIALARSLGGGFRAPNPGDGPNPQARTQP